MPNEKTFVLDTSVLIHDPENALLVFKEHAVVIPVVVIEELDRLKHHPAKGVNAREVSRQLSNFMQRGEINKGVATPGGGTVRVDLDGDDVKSLPLGFEPTADNIILLTARRLRDSSPNQEVVLVTKDIHLRVKAQSIGVKAQDYLSDRVNESSRTPKQITEIEVNDEAISSVYRHQTEMVVQEAGVSETVISSLHHHACLRLVGKTQRKTCLVILNKRSGHLEFVAKPSVSGKKKSGVLPRNEEQAFALALASSQSTTLVTLAGPAGTGKSLMALLAGWRQVIANQRGFEPNVLEPSCQEQRMVIYRPTRELGAELGFLPGTLEEKLSPWQRPTLSNLCLIAEEEGRGPDFLDGLFQKRKIEILPITHIRGDTVNHAFVVVDDAQNLTPHEIKAVVTRVGEGTRMIITGDPSQVDVDFLDSHSNGFSHVLAKFAGQEIYANLELVKGERSRLAEVAAAIL